MAGFFNPNEAFDPNNPQGFDYQEQARRLAMQQALAQRLGQPLGEGKMVSGWYVAPSKGQAMASALQQALGGYMQVKGAENEANLSKADRDAAAYFRKQYGNASDPTGYMDKAAAASPMPEAGYTYKHPEAVGPQLEDAPQTFQVAGGAVPPIPTSGGPMQPNNPGTPAWSSVPPIGKPMPAPGSAPVPTETDGFNVTQPSAEAQAQARAGQIKYLRQAMGADRDAALDGLSRTKSGGPLAQAIMARDFAPAEWDFQKVKVGDNEQLIAVNKRDPTQVRQITDAGAGGPSLAERKFVADQKDKAGDDARNNDKLLLDINAKREKTRSDLATTQSGIDAINSAIAATNKWGASGGLLSGARLKAGLALGEKDAVEVDNALKAVAALNISMFGPNPSNADREAIQKVTGDAAMGKAPTLKALSTLLERAQAAESAHKQTLGDYDSQATRYTPPPATRPGSYGQSVGSPADILGGRF